MSGQGRTAAAATDDEWTIVLDGEDAYIEEKTLTKQQWGARRMDICESLNLRVYYLQ